MLENVVAFLSSRLDARPIVNEFGDDFGIGVGRGHSCPEPVSERDSDDAGWSSLTPIREPKRIRWLSHGNLGSPSSRAIVTSIVGDELDVDVAMSRRLTGRKAKKRG
jgi:hypothetical protein